MSYNTDIASHDPKLALLTGFRTRDINEPEEL